MRGANRRKRTAGRIALAAGAVVAVGAGAVAATGIGGSSGGSSHQPHSSLPPATAKVVRQTLSDTQSESGQLGYGDATTVDGKLSGTITSLPTTGVVVNRGDTLYKVDNTPVVLMYGTLPVYRDLTVGTKGDDVKQFEQNLYALGYHSFTVGSTYTTAVADAVRTWQKAIGVTQTGTVEQGRVYYAPTAVRVDSDSASLGQSAKPGDAVVTTTGTQRMVAVTLDMSNARLAVANAPVAITLPDGTSTQGTISETKTVIDSSSNGGGGASGGGSGGSGSSGSSSSTTKLEVDIAFDTPNAAASLNQATVDVAFTASSRPDVLTVPVSALLSLAEGGYGLQVVDGATTHVIAVQTGLFADGRVEVSGDGVVEGLTVGVPA